MNYNLLVNDKLEIFFLSPSNKIPDIVFNKKLSNYPQHTSDLSQLKLANINILDETKTNIFDSILMPNLYLIFNNLSYNEKLFFIVYIKNEINNGIDSDSTIFNFILNKFNISKQINVKLLNIFLAQICLEYSNEFISQNLSFMNVPISLIYNNIEKISKYNDMQIDDESILIFKKYNFNMDKIMDELGTFFDITTQKIISS